ncbi:MAG: sulfotransferase family 2 domain-containing protein, partial [Rhodobacteraceae bacterium]|nr:sulfotransferase family 2 domain-containing protein [Paracoccaceae bacterium]
MAILYDNLGIAYFPVPKCASTSLKYCFYEANTGLVAKKQNLLKKIYIKMQSFAGTNLQELEGYERMAVVRDPVARLKSCYREKILRRYINFENNPDGRTHYLRYHDGEEKKLKSCNLPEYPDFETFVEHLEEYRGISAKIESHSRSLSYWLGSDPLFFDAIFDFSALPELGEWLQSRGGGGAKTHHR